MAALIAPARLPLSTVEEGLIREDEQHEWNRADTEFAWRHAYLHSLGVRERGTANGGSWEKEANQNPFGISLPKTIALPRLRRHGRSLSEPFLHARKMAVVAEAVDEGAGPDTIPSSPPELSSSKSSKSSNSSLRSDSLDEERSTEKLSHFDDISIEEAGRDSLEDSNLKPESRPTLRRPPPRIATKDDAGKHALPPLRLQENRYRGLRVTVSPVVRDQPLTLPGAREMRRGFSSPSTPSLMTYGLHRCSSRSPSPTKPFMQNGFSVSPSELANATPRLAPEIVSPGLTTPVAFARRKSWQPGQRKSAKEIEAEYNDEDEEVPEEAVLENVPISPMPGQRRLSQSFSRPQSRPESRETTPSPHRRALHTNLHSANVPKRAKRPSAPAVLPSGQYASPRSPKSNRPAALQHSQTMPVFLADPLNRKHRSKSWTEDLNEEARKLSAALEEHAERLSTEKLGSPAANLSSSPPRPAPKKPRAKSSVNLELPQVQRGNIMIDPLPISKEKEAVLTRTRPSWLPPKDQREEKKHMKEWSQMMARAAENERKRALKQQEAEETTEEVKHSIARIWDEHVLPNWDLVIQEPGTRELWWRGVTPGSRGVAWQKASGNELQLSEASFSAALNRATALEEKVAEMPPEERSKSKEAAWFDAIARDVPSTCPEVTEVEKRAPFQDALCDVLKAYAMYRSDVGYVYGTHLVAGILCLHLRPADAFVTLANMLNRPLPVAFLVHDTAAMVRTYDVVLSALKYKFTKLHDHLTCAATGIKAEEYLDPMFRCLFAYNLPTDYVSRIWDIFVFEGDKALIRAAVAILGLLEGKLYGTRDEILDLISWRSEGKWEVGSEENFIAALREAGKVDCTGEATPIARARTPEEG